MHYKFLDVLSKARNQKFSDKKPRSAQSTFGCITSQNCNTTQYYSIHSYRDVFLLSGKPTSIVYMLDGIVLYLLLLRCIFIQQGMSLIRLHCASLYLRYGLTANNICVIDRRLLHSSIVLKKITYSNVSNKRAAPNKRAV